MHELISLWMSWVQDWGYAGVIVLMAMESSIFPVPSEVVIPPAAILSAQDGASMSFWGVVVAGTFGSWLGSAITYAVARIVGRPVIMRWGKFFSCRPTRWRRRKSSSSGMRCQAFSSPAFCPSSGT
ncbi:hypothetical protein PVA48_15270 [Akkermansia sp. JRP_AM1]|uniref:DedA family protein n=1 Tax=Akkermansia sp. JRP_AM1 TaxID=3414159 RepID=UPI003BFA6F71